MKNSLIAVALASLVATSAEAGDRGWHGHHHGGGHHFWWGAAVGAALALPFYYSRTWADPGPYYYGPYSGPYYGRGPTVYVSPPVYVQSQPVYVQAPPSYVAAAPQPGNAATRTPSDGVIELGPVNSLPPVNSNSDQPPSSNTSGAPDPWFVYPSRGQSRQQAANDRYECNRWAVNESGYDPDLRTHRNPETGPVAYGRALSACLEGRGYAVR